MGLTKQTLMIHSDVEESTVLGAQKHPLLRKVQLERLGQGRATVEPINHEWIKLRSNRLEITEVQIATPEGPLVVLATGKTLVTIGGFDEYKRTIPLLITTMLGGFPTWYHTPSLRGKGFPQESVKLAGPTLIRFIGHGLQACEKGSSLEDTSSSSGQVLKKGLKRKLPAGAGVLAKQLSNKAIKRKSNGSKTYSVCSQHETWT